MPLQQTSGNVTADGYGGGVAAVPQYIEDVFSTYLYNGNDSTQTITNGIDLSTKGGLVWIKSRNLAGTGQFFQDTVRGANQFLDSTTTGANQNIAAVNTTFSTTGFSQNNNYLSFNGSGYTYASWTFRKQPKFFDVVTYTGTGVARTIAHSLGSVPGCIIIKRTDASGTLWYVYHRANTSGGSAQSQELRLNNTNATNTNTDVWNNTAPTSTVFSIGAGASPYDWNASGGTYVAYLFAHNAGGFGLTGTDNVISCGSFTTDGSGNATVNLGYEPQWLLIKSVTFGGWWLTDTMRGMSIASGDNVKALFANSSGAESNANEARPNATGFTVGPSGNLSTSDTFIYIAIRRGPMKVPTSGTSVFYPNATSAAAGTVVTTNFPVDLEIGNFLDNYDNKPFTDRLRGYATSTSSRTGAPFINSVNALGELTTGAPFSYNWWNKSVIIGNYISEYRQVSYYFGRSPNFFDVVCYTGTGSATTVAHNLGVSPELIIIKKRSNTSDWAVLQTGVQKQLYLNGNYAGDVVNATYFGNDSVYVAPTSTVFSLGSSSGVNGVSGQTFVAYLFATCAGVSKVGSYTGTGALQTVNCGFTSGARFVLIKRTDSTGDWYVYDSARGITSGNDPYLFLNTNGAEVAGTNYVDTDSTGFKVTAAAPAGLNASGGTYIFLAIA